MNTQIVPIERADDSTLIVSSLTIADGGWRPAQELLELVVRHGSDLKHLGAAIHCASLL